MRKPSKSAPRVAEAIRKAIADHVITTAEYEEILALVDADRHIDAEEKALMVELQALIANGTVVRRP